MTPSSVVARRIGRTSAAGAVSAGALWIDVSDAMTAIEHRGVHSHLIDEQMKANPTTAQAREYK